MGIRTEGTLQRICDVSVYELSVAEAVRGICSLWNLQSPPEKMSDYTQRLHFNLKQRLIDMIICDYHVDDVATRIMRIVNTEREAIANGE